jgi:hypothetical protein
MTLHMRDERDADLAASQRLPTTGTVPPTVGRTRRWRETVLEQREAGPPALLRRALETTGWHNSGIGEPNNTTGPPRAVLAARRSPPERRQLNALSQPWIATRLAWTAISAQVTMPTNGSRAPT